MFSRMLLATVLTGCSAVVKDAGWDCQFRQLASDYARDVVLSPAAGWTSARARSTLALVGHGLNLAECNITTATGVDGADSDGSEAAGGGGVTVYVATTGSDSAAGTYAAPLRTVAGAQSWIRARYPTVSSRPGITVAIQPGEYRFGEDAADHLVRATR